MIHIRSNIQNQMSDMNVLTEIVKNMEVPDGILNHVLEPGKDYNYTVCEFLAEAIEVSDKERFYVLNMRKTPMGDAIFSKIGAYECINMAKLGWSGKFNNQRDAETAKKYSSSIISLCKEQSKLISKKEKKIVFDNAYKVYLKMPPNENKSIEEEYDNSLDLLRYHVNKTKDIYNYLTKKHEFILDNFSCLNKILIKYFEKKQNTENLIESAYKPYFDVLKSENFVLDELNILNKNLNHTNNVNYLNLKDLIIKIQEHAKYLELDSNNINQAIKKILITKLTSQLKNRLENLL